MAVLGLRLCARAFSSCGKRGPLFIAVHGPLTIAASPVAEHRLQTRRLSNCGPRAQPLRGMWNPPRPGLEPVSPALAGRFSTTAPPGKPPGRLIFKQQQQKTFCEVVAVLTNPIVVIISIYMCVSNHLAVHKNYTMLYVSYISMKPAGTPLKRHSAKLELVLMEVVSALSLSILQRTRQLQGRGRSGGWNWKS